MKDISIIQNKVILPVQMVNPIRGFQPPSILVIGSNLSLTRQVFYNGIEVKDYIVSANSRLVVKIPTSQIGKSLTDLKVLTTVQVSKSKAAIFMELGKPPRFISGIDRLVQSWMMVFLTNPGSSIFEPGSGGGSYGIIGRATDVNHRSASADLSVAIDNTKNELLRLQASQTGIPPSEKLMSCTINSINFDPSSSILSAVVYLQNMLGESAQVAVG